MWRAVVTQSNCYIDMQKYYEIKYDLQKEIKTMQYNSLGRPQLEYASAAWSPYTKENTCIGKLKKVERRAARWVSND